MVARFDSRYPLVTLKDREGPRDQRMTRGSNLSFVLVLALSGCATTPAERLTTSPRTLPTLQGSYHRVRTGETLWRIAQSYGLETDTLASANRLSNASQLKAGQHLFIPLPVESDRFLWPVRGSVRNPGTSKGLEIAAAPGSLVRASRSGRVAIATGHLAGWGKTVVLDHLDGYYTIYSKLDQILVSPGADLRQGTPVGSLGAHALYFEIRHGVRLRDALALLPTK